MVKIAGQKRLQRIAQHLGTKKRSVAGEEKTGPEDESEVDALLGKGGEIPTK